MKRRHFLQVAAGGFAAAALSVLPSCDSSTGRPAFLRWTWVHGGGARSPEQWRSRYRRLAAAGFHGVLVSGGDVGVHSEAAHAAGLEMHRWVWILNRSGDEDVKAAHPEWFTVSRNGDSSLEKPPYVGYYQWLCPTRPEVRAYLRDSIAEIAREPGVDGIHLDYIRHCDVILPRGLWSKYNLVQDKEYPEYDFCYCDVCREIFRAQHHRDPLEIPDPPADEDWRRFRWDSVTGLVEALAEAVHGTKTAGSLPGGTTLPEGGSVSRLSPDGVAKPVTAAVFPTPGIARALVRQAWDEWPVDAVFPMLYHSFYEEDLEWIGEGVREGLRAMAARGESGPEPGAEQDTTGHRHTPARLLAGLYLPALSMEERTKAEEIVRKAGAHGVSFFELSGLES